jgi:hypothetical protein
LGRRLASRGHSRGGLTLHFSLSISRGAGRRSRPRLPAPAVAPAPEAIRARAATVPAVDDEKPLHERAVNQGEETLGRLAQELLESSVVSGVMSAAFETRERAMRAQEMALAALNLPSASDLERLTRRLRNVSQRLEASEDGLDRLDQRVEELAVGGQDQGRTALEARLDAVEATLARLETTLTAAKPEQ